MAGGRVGAGDDENSITDVTASDTRMDGRSQSLIILIIINLPSKQNYMPDGKLYILSEGLSLPLSPVCFIALVMKYVM